MKKQNEIDWNINLNYNKHLIKMAETSRIEYKAESKALILVEQLGSGIPRILECYSKDCFKFSDNFLRMSFPVNNVLKTEEVKGGAIGGAIDGAIKDLTDRQKEVLELIIENNKIGYQEIAKKLEINNSAVQAHINALKNKNIIIREGGTRGYWKIIAKQL